MYCTHCGKKLSEGNKFCPNCGKKSDSGTNALDSAINIVNNIFTGNADAKQNSTSLDALSQAILDAEEDESLDADETTRRKLALIDRFQIRKNNDDITAFVIYALSQIDTKMYKLLTRDKLQNEINEKFLSKAKLAISLLPQGILFGSTHKQLTEELESVKSSIRRNKRIRRLKIFFIGFGLLMVYASIYE